MRKTFPLEERLAILRTADLDRKWYAVDDRRVCAVCDRKFTGRQIDITLLRNGGYRLTCPTADCPSNISHWFLYELSPARSSQSDSR